MEQQKWLLIDYGYGVESDEFTVYLGRKNNFFKLDMTWILTKFISLQ